MSLILPRRFKSQPQFFAPVDKGAKLASGLVSTVVFDNAGQLVDRATGNKYTVTSGAYRTDRPGRVVYFSGAGYVNTGAQTIGGVNLFADSTSQWSVVICARLEASGNTGSYIAKCGANGATRTFQIFRDVFEANQTPSFYLRGSQTVTGWGYTTADWHQYTVTWDGSTAKAYGDHDKESTLSVGTAAQESENIVFGARTGGTGFLLTGRIAYAYFFNRAISKRESVDIYRDPWRVFKAPSKRLWVASASSGHDLTTANATQANTASDGLISQGHALSAQASAQTNTGSTGAITQTHALVGASSTQTNTASTGAVSKTEIHNLAVSNAVQTNTGSTPAITQTHVLVHSPSIQDNVAAASAIVQQHVLAIANAMQSNAASEAAITVIGINNLAAGPITQGNEASTGRITRPQTITIANAEQINTVSTGTISDGIIFESALSGSTQAPGAIKKPGIPNDTPAWLKTSMEIVLGRRGNRISVPDKPGLTFSSTPTQAECEALYNYTNNVRDSLAQLVNRLDS